MACDLVRLLAIIAVVAACDASCDTEPIHSVMLLQKQLSLGKMDAPRSRLETLPALGFIKTHKTGSSTMRDILEGWGASRASKIMVPPDKINLGWPGPFPGKEVVDSVGPPTHQFSMIFNHAVFSETMREYLEQGAFFFSILREPLSQTMSAFDYYTGCTKGKDWPSRIEFLESLRDSRYQMEGFEDRCRAEFQNPQAHDLGWYEHAGNTSAFDQDAERVEAWLHDLDRSMDLVLVMEAFDEGLVLLAERLGLAVEDVQYVRQKVHKGDHMEPSDAQAAKVLELQHVDRLLHEHFTARFWEAWEAAGGDKLKPKLEKLQALNKQLQDASNEDDT